MNEKIHSGFYDTDRPLLLQKEDLERLEDKISETQEELTKIKKPKIKLKKELKTPKIKNLIPEFKNIEKIVDELTLIDFMDPKSLRKKDYQVRNFNYLEFLKRDGNACIGLGGMLIALSLTSAIETYTGIPQFAMDMGLLAGGISYVDTLKKNTSSFYDKKNNIIWLNQDDYYRTVLTFAHEYTHHIQNLMDDIWFSNINDVVESNEEFEENYLKLRRIKEGHAFSLEKSIADIYSKKEDDANYIIRSKNTILCSLTGAWWILKNYFDTKSSKAIEEISETKHKKIHDPMHDEGYAYFEINNLGPASIYGEVLNLLKVEYEKDYIEEV